MSEKTNDLLQDFNVTLEFSVKEINELLSILGQAPFVHVVGFINSIHRQAAPQVEQARKSLEAVEKANES